VVLTEEPEELMIALLGSLASRTDGHGVVATALDVTGASGPSTDILGISKKLNRRETSGIVRADRRADDIELCMGRGGDAEERSGGDEGGAEVKRVAKLVGNPVLVNAHKLLETEKGLITIDGREQQALGTAVHAVHVHFRTEEANVIVRVNVSLHTLEALKSIVKGRGSRVNRKITMGADLRGAPAIVHIPVNLKHVISERMTELQSLKGLLLLRRRSLLHNKFRKLPKEG
jgi:hypothetical protein